MEPSICTTTIGIGKESIIFAEIEFELFAIISRKLLTLSFLLFLIKITAQNAIIPAIISNIAINLPLIA